MLLRYLSFMPSAKLVVLPMVAAIGFLPVANANNTVLIDSTGKPLPSDFGALLEQLGQLPDNKKRKILGLESDLKTTSSTPKVVEVAPTPISVEKMHGAEKRVETESEKPAAKPRNPAFYNPELARRLYDALDVGDAARTKWLLQSGAGNVYTTDKNDTSLRLAIRKRWASVVRVLLERDPDLEQKLPGNVNLLHDASAQGAYDIAKMLIEAGIDPQEKTAKNWTNLHLAARYGHVDMVRYYLSLGLDPDARNSEGNTAHWLASHLRHYQVAGYLSSRTNVTSHQIFDDRKSGSGKTSKKRKRSRISPSQAFSPAQLEALRNL